MSHRILILQRDAQGPAVWRYRLADDDGELPAGAHRLRHDPAPGFEPVAESAESARMFWPTVILLVRQGGGRNRIV